MNGIMDHALVVAESIEINASPAQVWATLTTPALIAKFLFGTETLTDWRVGSEIVFQGTYGERNEHRYRDKGVVLAHIPRVRLSYSYWSGFSGLADTPENYAVVTYLLEPRGTKTHFTWEQRGFPDQARHEHAKAGMADFLKTIAAIAEDVEVRT